ncbi:hypothetical protein WMY93_012166 [Mugilogobius chulae]|uniref:Peptidase metallopeptidase domain-containing protein n=1 Tax=Mugilogobius chulae TaxID=88201 RepID=A0AAW0P4Y8_9GOBI
MELFRTCTNNILQKETVMRDESAEPGDRAGLTHTQADVTSLSRTRRTALGEDVPKDAAMCMCNNCCIKVRTFPKDAAGLLGRDTVRALMYYALKVWSDIAPLNFHEVAGSDADIQIDFTKADHNDGYPFDGPGGTVAHAFFPERGSRPGHALRRRRGLDLQISSSGGTFLRLEWSLRTNSPFRG